VRGADGMGGDRGGKEKDSPLSGILNTPLQKNLFVRKVNKNTRPLKKVVDIIG